MKTDSSGALVVPEARGVRSGVIGRAVVVEAAPGRYLFALLSGSGEEKRDASHWVYPAYHLTAAGSYGAAMMKVQSQRFDTPVPLPPEGWPTLVTFDDIPRPETVREVNPVDLAAVFGERVRLEAVTEGQVEGVLEWWCKERTAGSLNDDPKYFGVNALLRNISSGDFRIGECTQPL